MDVAHGDATERGGVFDRAEHNVVAVNLHSGLKRELLEEQGDVEFVGGGGTLFVLFVY